MDYETNENVEMDELEIDFKPINRGLGFHQQEERIRQTPKKSNHGARAGVLASKLIVETAIAPKPQLTSPVLDTKWFRATNIERFASWAVDLVCISMIIASVLLVFSRFTGVSLSRLVMINGIEESLLFLGSIYCFFYLLYFTLLDFSSTPGKYLFGLKLVNVGKGRLRMHQTFMRSFVTLTTGLLLFVPTMIKSDNKISQTSVCKR